jgi:hypothetical protein
MQYPDANHRDEIAGDISGAVKNLSCIEDNNSIYLYVCFCRRGNPLRLFYYVRIADLTASTASND